MRGALYLSLVAALVASKQPSRPTVRSELADAGAPPTSAVASAPTVSASSATREPSGPARVERIDVPGDLPAFVVRGEGGHPPRNFFLAGLCSNAEAYLLGFPESARRAGGIVTIDGDLPCPGAPGFRSLSSNAEKQHARIEAALAAAGTTTIPKEGLTVIGSSLGAAIFQTLASKYPERYPRVAIIASASDPIAERFAKTRAVVTMSCSLDVPGRMKAAAKRIEALGVPSRYIEMPGCTHGNLAEAEPKFGELFSFLDEHGRNP